jgi:hypothetical protein
MRNSHTHCHGEPADPQAKTWQRVWLSTHMKVQLKERCEQDDETMKNRA